jgi:galactonate dehydratase
MTNSTSRRSFIKKTALTAGFIAPVATYASGLEAALEKSPKTLSKPSDLKITELKCGYIRNGHSLFVKIYTNQDIWGCGEGVDAVPGTYHPITLLKCLSSVSRARVH